MFATKVRPPRDAGAATRPSPSPPQPESIANFCQEPQTPPFVFSSLRTLLPMQKFQHLYFHSLRHSLQYEQNITPAFPITPALSLRSSASEQKLTALLSCACALFRKTTREGGTPSTTQVKPLREIPLSPVSFRSPRPLAGSRMITLPGEGLESAHPFPLGRLK
jgi:hypothetical protein